MKSYILRREGVGPETCPKIAEIAGLTVINGSVETVPNDAEYVFRWGSVKTIQNGPKIVNKASAISTTSDKKNFRMLLSSQGLAPLSFSSLEDMWMKMENWPNGPFLVRPAHHQRSENMHLATSPQELVKAVKKIQSEVSAEYYISEFVNKQREFRVFVCQNRILWMIEKHPKSADELSWGCVEQGNFDYVGWSEWPQNVAKTALLSMKASSLDFGAVDIIVDEEGRALTTEINTAPWLSPYYIKCIGKAFKHIVENGREHFSDPETFGWKNVIHPAVGG